MVFQKSKEHCSIHTSGMFVEQKRNLAKIVMASTLSLNDNSQHDSVMGTQNITVLFS